MPLLVRYGYSRCASRQHRFQSLIWKTRRHQNKATTSLDDPKKTRHNIYSIFKKTRAPAPRAPPGLSETSTYPRRASFQFAIRHSSIPGFDGDGPWLFRSNFAIPLVDKWVIHIIQLSLT